MTATLPLPPRLDLTTAASLARALQDAPAGALTLDAQNCGHFGTPGVQVIAAAAKDRKSAGGELSLANLSEGCADQLRLLGLSPETLCSGDIK